MEKIHLSNGWLIFQEHYLEPDLQQVLFQHLLTALPWHASTITIFGKTYPTPRLEAYFAENGKTYGYSGKQLIVHRFQEDLLQLKNQIEKEFKLSLNACLANLYRDGNDSNGWHADNEKELGKNPVIASISLGQTRKFQLKHLITHEKININLSAGSLLIMGGEMQHYWKHQIPKQKGITSSRINLTFRKIC